MEIFEDKELRHLIAKSVSVRLGLPYGYVRDRFDQLHRIAEYDSPVDDVDQDLDQP